MSFLFQTFHWHCWFPGLFCLWSLYMELPSPSSLTETRSGPIQVKPYDIFPPKTLDLPCFPFRAVVFIRLKSLLAARFKLWVNYVLFSQYAHICGCLCVCAWTCVYMCVCVCVCVCVHVCMPVCT